MDRRRARNLIGSAAFLLVAPGTVAGLVPWLLTRWRAPAGGAPAWAAAAGVLLMACAAPILLDAFRRFATEGEGTPAPPAPTRKLVVTGAYRYVRNPMYVAVAALIFGQALVFWSPRLAVYGALVCLAFHVFVIFFEEPRLAREHGAGYELYRRNVPRWRPRLTPWRGGRGASKSAEGP